MSLLDFLTLDTWITSDQHWGHDNIQRYQDRPLDHFRLMQARWIEKVQPYDTVFHLGDLVCFGDRSLHEGYISGLTGEKYLLLGNHDEHARPWYEAAGFTVLGRKPLFWHRPDNGQRICFSHEPEVDVGGWAINVHGHTHKNRHHAEVDRRGSRRNVCVENTLYAPMRLREVLDG